MKTMEWILNNWYLIVIAIAVIVAVIVAVMHFLGLPREAQIAKVKEWLLYAVTLAEKELGSGTGQIKLRYVYDLFVTKFPWLVKIIAFETFSDWVDDALDEMRSLIQTNEKIDELVHNK